MGIIGFIFLSSAISYGSIDGASSETKDAYSALFKASYIQTGIDKKVKTFEKKITPRYLKKYGIWVAGIGRLATDGKFSLEWSF